MDAYRTKLVSLARDIRFQDVTSLVRAVVEERMFHTTWVMVHLAYAGKSR